MSATTTCRSADASSGPFFLGRIPETVPSPHSRWSRAPTSTMNLWNVGRLSVAGQRNRRCGTRVEVELYGRAGYVAVVRIRLTVLPALMPNRSHTRATAGRPDEWAHCELWSVRVEPGGDGGDVVSREADAGWDGVSQRWSWVVGRYPCFGRRRWSRRRPTQTGVLLLVRRSGGSSSAARSGRRGRPWGGLARSLSAVRAGPATGRCTRWPRPSTW